MDRKRPRVDARDCDASRKHPGPLHDRPASKQPRREEMELPASLRGRVVMPDQQAREQQGSRGKPWQQQHQRHKDSRPALSQQHLGGSGRELGGHPGRDIAPGRAPPRHISGNNSTLAHAQQLRSQDGKDRSSSAPRAATPSGAFREPAVDRQRASQYDMSSTQRPRPQQYSLSSTQHNKAEGRPVAGQQQRPLGARGPPPAPPVSRPSGHFPDSRHTPHQQQHGGRQQHGSRPASAGRDRPAQPPTLYRGSSSNMQPGDGRGRPASRDSRDSSRAAGRPGQHMGTPRREQRAAEPGSSARQAAAVAPSHTPAAAAAAVAAAQVQPSPRRNGQPVHDVPPVSQQQQQQQQQQQHSDEHASEQELTGSRGNPVPDEQQAEPPGGAQQQECGAAAVAAAAASGEKPGSPAAPRAAAVPAAAAAAADGGGRTMKRRPIEFNLASLPGPSVGGLQPRVSSKYSLPQLGQQQQAPAQQQQASQAAGRSGGDRVGHDGAGAAGSADVSMAVAPSPGRSRRGSEAASHSEHRPSSEAPGHSNGRMRSGGAGSSSGHRRSSEAGCSVERREHGAQPQPQQQQRRGLEAVEARGPSRAAASRGRRSRSSSRSPSRSRSVRSCSRDHSARSGSRQPAADRHATPARSDHHDHHQRHHHQQQPGRHPASSEHHEAAGTQSSLQQALSQDDGAFAAGQLQQLGSQHEAELQQHQQQPGGKQVQQVPAPESSRHLTSPATTPDAAAASAAAAAPGIARLRSLTPAAAASDAPHGLGLAALRRPTQQMTLPLQPASPLAAPQPAAAAAAGPGCVRPAEVELRVASLRARRQGMVALQLRGLPISRHMAYRETWAAACKAGSLRPELVDGPPAAARRQAAAAQALRPRFGASLLSPVDAAAPVPVGGGGEEAHIQQLQRVIDAMAAQEAAPHCVALPDGGSMLLPAALQGLLW